MLITCALGLQHPFFFVDFIFIEYVCLLHDQLKNIGYGGSDGDKNEKCKTSSIPMKLGHNIIGNSYKVHAKKVRKKSCYIFQNWHKISSELYMEQHSQSKV